MRTQTTLISLILSVLVLLQAQAYSETGKKELSEADKTRIKTSFGKLPLYFIKNLGQVHKDVAYYGNEVSAQDFDRVLLRWRLEDGRYRVIYGDLRADTVTAGQLAELEDIP